jgi:hypothetical protein
MARFQVMVDDNFHYMDESERFAHGGFDSLEAAVDACRRMVDRDLGELHRPGMSGDELYRQYVSFGSDPYIVGVGPDVPFSAWDYAQERSRAIAASTQ